MNLGHGHLDNVLWNAVEELNWIHSDPDRFRMRFAPHEDVLDSHNSSSDHDDHYDDNVNEETVSGSHASGGRNHVKTFGKRRPMGSASKFGSHTVDWTSNLDAAQRTLNRLPRMRRTVPNSNPLDFVLSPHALQDLKQFNLMSRIAYNSHDIRSVEDLTEHERQTLLDDEMRVEQQKHDGKYGEHLKRHFEQLITLNGDGHDWKWEDYLREEMNSLLKRGLERVIKSQKSLDMLAQHGLIDSHDRITSRTMKHVQKDVQQQIDQETMHTEESMRHLNPQSQGRLRRLLIGNSTKRYRFLNYLVDKQYRLQQEVMSVFKNKEHIYQEPFGPLGLEPPLHTQHPLQYNHVVFNEEPSLRDEMRHNRSSQTREGGRGGGEWQQPFGFGGGMQGRRMWP